MTPLGREGKQIGAPSRRIEELATHDRVIARRFGSFCPGQGYGNSRNDPWLQRQRDACLLQYNAAIAGQTRSDARSGTISESAGLVRGADGGTIAMRIEYLAAIAIVAAGAGLAVHSVGSLPPEKQSTPAATQLATLLAESVDPFLHRSGG